MSEVKYENWWSKVLFKKAFEEQFFIPVPLSTFEQFLLRTIEKYKFNLDLSEIKIEKPIFIIGLPRSGTTMLYNILCAHERAAYITNSINSCSESICAIEWLRKKLRLNVTGERMFKDSIITDLSSPAEPLTLWKKWIGRGFDELVWNEKKLSDLPEGKLDEIHHDVKKILYCFANNGRYICKYPVAQPELKLLQEIFPDIKIIHIVRDGREVANSLLKLYRMSNEQLQKINHPLLKSIVPYPRLKSLPGYIEKYGADDIRTTACIWRDAIDLVQRTKTELKDFYEVRYEDILQSPKSEMGKILNFCELEWPVQSNTLFQKEFDKIGVVHHKNNYHNFDVVEKYAGETLKEFNYL